jgi:uncharacterized protein YecE (DUF72 family)
MGSKTKGRFWTGTSNIVLPMPKYNFPEEHRDKSRLGYYSSLFNSLEINSSFYKLPMPRTFARWAEEVPDDFRFTVKLLKDITHAKGLLYEPELVVKFMSAAAHLGSRKGCLLIQLPASITIHFARQIERLLEEVQACDPYNEWKKAVEFRHHSWYSEPVLKMLHKYNAAVVVQDMPKSKTPELEQEEDFTYLRYHGTESNYRGSYHPEALQADSMQIKQWLKEGRDVYAYFNNTLGDAFENAKLLDNLVRNK